jgi:hydrogenase expression/formation protein HypC
MCLSVPARIMSIDGDFAEVQVGGAIFRASVQMIGNPAVGDFILLHAGFAIQKISSSEAIKTLQLLREMSEATSKSNEP